MEPLALYIHWPFCAAKCPYCDFNSHVRDRVDEARFRAALRQELAYEAALVGRRPLASIFFGGGTPSLMSPETVAALIQDASRYFDPLPDIEITLEANPTSVEAAKLAAFRDAGVNRASLGVQSLNAAALGFLGRKHDVPQAIAALEAARRALEAGDLPGALARLAPLPPAARAALGAWEADAQALLAARAAIITLAGG